MLHLSNLPKIVQKEKKRVGRGIGSGTGKNSGKGNKGQNKHGQGVRIGFEGGQKPLIRRTPKFRGFKIYKKASTQSFPVGVINNHFNDGDVVTLSSLLEKGLITKFVDQVRIINSGEFTKKITFEENQNIYLTKGVKSLLNK
jgi:large subunit ribosomal protein L15